MSYIWITKDGREIPIEQMGDSHLRNVQRMLHRVPAEEQYLEALGEIYKAGCYLQGEMALDSVDSAANELEYQFEQWMELRGAIDEEVKSRNL